MSPESSLRGSLPSALVVSEYFKDSRHLSIGDNGNFSTVHGDQHNAYYLHTGTGALLQKKKFIVGTEEEEAEYGEFPEIQRGECVAIRNICRSDARWRYDEEQRKYVEWRGERTVVAGDVRFGAVASRCTVVQYSGQEAGELWKEDFCRLSGVRRPEKAQLVAINLSTIPMLILTGDLVPLAHLKNRVGKIGRTYLRALAMQMGCFADDSLWMDTSRGVFCRGPRGPWCYLKGDFDFGGLPLDTELLKEDVLVRYLASRKQDRKVIQGLSWPWDTGTSLIKVNRPTFISTLTDTIVAVGSGVQWEGKESCLGKREELANGATRFTLDHNGRRLELRSDWWEPIYDWVAQAPSVFHAHRISIEDNMFPYNILIGTLSSSEIKRQRRKECPPIYLFIPRLSTSTFWSFDSDGQNPITDLCYELGLPISLSLECEMYYWLNGTYKALRDYQIARGFDPNTTEFAQHNGYRIYEIVEQPLPSRFEEIQNLEEHEESGVFNNKSTETPIHSVHLEEPADMVLSGKVQPEELPASTMTQGHALRKGAGYSNYPHSNPTAPFSASKDFPHVDTAEVNCTLPQDPKSVSPSAETSPRAHSKDGRTVPVETKNAIPQPQHPPTDIILCISSFNVQKIICQEGTTYKFQSNQSTSPPPSFNRVWFYVTAPESRISYVCNVGTMVPTDRKTKGKGRKETSDCTISFPIESLYRLRQPLALSALKQRFGFKSAPRVGTILPVPMSMLEVVPWQTQELVWPLQTQSSDPAAAFAVPQKQVRKKAEVKRKAWR
ncbi:hypothetical protein V5O48_009319 [Marasmius crinis-equi]|uniref:Uncharacterized protein n=1 Tax=Marasmius crinis-equi TaxID=585013 RepID=A0ABR3FC07_9AGAR